MTRPSLQLDRDIFDAILSLEESVLAQGPPRESLDFFHAVVETGRRRDALARLILNEQPDDMTCAECGTARAGTYVVTLVEGSRTEVCRECQDDLTAGTLADEMRGIADEPTESNLDRFTWRAAWLAAASIAGGSRAHIVPPDATRADFFLA